MLRRRLFTRLVTIGATLSVIASYGGVVTTTAAKASGPPAHIVSGLQSWFTYLGGLANAGAFGSDLTGTTLDVGGANGLDLKGLTDAVNAASDWTTADSVDGVASALNGLDGDFGSAPKWHLTTTATSSSASGVDRIAVSTTITRTVDVGLGLHDPSTAFELTSPSGVSAQLTATLSFTAADDGTNFWIDHTATSSPSLGVGVSASLDPSATISAGLGILGVTVTSPSTAPLTLTGHVTTGFADPNGDGRLDFTESDGTTAGELAAAGSAGGIATPTLDAGGTLSGDLTLTGQTSALIPGLPSLSATVHVNSSDLSSGNMTVTSDPGAFDAVKAFQTMSVKDLADALAQMAATLDVSERAQDHQLPLLHGSIADAVQSAEGIKAFLQKWVQQPPTGADLSDPTKYVGTGHPLFASIQDLATKLNTFSDSATGAAIDLVTSSTGYNASDPDNNGNPTLSLDLHLHRHATLGVPLDVSGPTLTGSGSGVTYGDNFLKDTGKTFTADVANRQVTVGTTTALIDHVDSSDSSKLILSSSPFANLSPAPTVLWTSGKPADGTAYSIAGQDPRTGQVEMGNALETASGLVNFNATVPQATIKPSYDVNVPIVLDLEPSQPQDPPQQVTNDDGTSSVVSSLPTVAQRIMLKTGTDLVTADLPIDTSVDATAKVGFLQVHATGTLKLCTSDSGVADDCTGTAASKHFFSLSTVAQSSVYQNLPHLFALIRDHAGSFFDAQINGRAYASLTLNVPGADTFFTGSSATVTVKWADVTDPNTLDVSGSGLPDLKSFDISGLDDPTKLFGALLSALQSLDASLHAPGSGSSAFDTKLPLLGRSIHDLLAGVELGGAGATYATDSLTDNSRDFSGYAGRRVVVGSSTAVITDVSSDHHTVTLAPPFAAAPANDTPYAIGDSLLAALDQLASNPSSSLNDMVDLLNQKLGTDVVKFSVIPGSGSDPSYLKLAINWTRAFNVDLPIDFSLKNISPDIPDSLVGTSGSGTIHIGVNGNINVGVLFPLSADAIADPVGSVKVDPNSSASVDADLNGDDLTFAANLGPLALSIGDPSATTPGTSLQGKLGFALAGPGGSDPVSLSAFFSGLSASEKTRDAVTCAGVTQTDLALCANLPIFYKNGSTWTALGSGIHVHVPQTNIDFTDLSQYVDLPSASDIATALASQFIDMSALSNGLQGYLQLLNQALQLADQAGKLPVVGGDIQQGLDFINGVKNAIQSVLPVDTNDGSENVDNENKIQNKLDDIAGQLATSMGIPKPHFYVATDCKAKLDQVTGVSATATSPGSGHTYAYRVVATRSGNTSGDARPSDASADVTNGDTLDGTHFNSVAWTPSTWATGYRIERKKDGGDWKKIADVSGQSTASYDDKGATESDIPTEATDDPVLVPCPGSAINGFKIKVVIGQGTPSSDKGCEDNGTADPCASVASRPLDLGLPGLSLSTDNPDYHNELASDPNAGVQAKIGWKLHMSFGITRDKGFVVYTQDNDSDPRSPDSSHSTPELLLGAAIIAPRQFDARLAFLGIHAKDTDAETDTSNRSFTGAFSLDLHGKGDTACPPDSSGCATDLTKVLTIDDIISASPSDLITARLDAGVKLHYQVTVNSDSALPGIRADFHLDWGWNSTDPKNLDNLDVGFDDVRVNPGAFLGSVLEPIFEKINALYGPIKPVLDTVSAPIPVLSDLSHLAGGGDVSILSLASVFASGAGDPATFDQFVKIFKTVKDVLDTINAISDACSTGNPSDYQDDSNFCIHIGSFSLKDGAAFNTTATPDTADDILGTQTPSGDGSLFDQLDTKTGGKLTSSQQDGSVSGKNACGADGKDTRGFSFTAMKDPKSLFGLLMGKDVELVCFDSGPLTLGFTMSESFGPVYAPPPVLIVISGSASVTAHIVAGFDTYGIRKAVEDSDAGVLARAADFLDSLYFKTVDTSGHPIPVLQFQGTLAAGAEVSAVIISVGVEGGVSLTVSFYWNDPDNDGKFRFREFLATALKNPICLFNVGGELDLFLKVFITIGFSPFDVSFDFTLVNLKLLDFSIKPDCTPPPPELAGKTDGGVLYLFAGRLGTGTNRGDSAYDNSGTDDEKVVVRQHGDPGTSPANVTVQMLGITEDFDNVTKVILDGRNYGGKIQALFQGAGDASSGKQSQFTLPTIVVGGTQDDVIKTGNGPTWVDGGGGNDQIATGDRPDLTVSPGDPAVVSGGAGNDSIAVGNADDTVFGDTGLTLSDTSATLHRNNGRGDVTPGSMLSASAPGAPSDGDTGSGNDRISLGLGSDTAWGGGGDDVIGVAADSPLAALHTDATHANYVSKGVNVYAGGGSDRISTGSGDDTVFTGKKYGTGGGDDAVADRNVSADPDAGTSNTVDTGAGTDTVYGDNGADFVTGHSAGSEVDTFFGGPDTDVLMGGYGKDKLFGGDGDDYLIAEPSTVGAPNSTSDFIGGARTVMHTATNAAPQEKLLVGGGGHDRIYGGDGGAKIYGDHRDFTCSIDSGLAGPESSPPSEAGVLGTDASDLIIGGNGVDDVNAGGGNDNVQAKGGDDFVCGSADKDTIDAGTGADKVWGGSGDDLVYGSDGADHLYGNDGKDTIYGGNDADIIEGNASDDTLFGGDANDTIIGGTREIGDPDGSDTISGDTGNDLLIGDNGEADPSDDVNGKRVGAVFDLDGTHPSYGAADLIYGSTGEDSAYGGLGNDVVSGGDDDDYIEGNNGQDTLHGDNGQDDIIGGSSQSVSGSGLGIVGYPDDSDTISGGPDQDAILGDNGSIARDGTGSDFTQGRGMTVRTMAPYDWAGTDTTLYGGDDITGDGSNDVVLGEAGPDTIHGNGGDDYLEGNQGADSVFGDTGQDDILGGSSQVANNAAKTGLAATGEPDVGDTVLSGGTEQDVVVGDNGFILRTALTGASTVTGTLEDVTKGHGVMSQRRINLYDIGNSSPGGGDVITGGSEDDALFGGAGDDTVNGDDNDDYVEGDQGSDTLHGDAGQDDILGGSALLSSGTNTGTSSDVNAAGEPDAGDTITGDVSGADGDGSPDVILGDNGQILRIGASAATSISSTPDDVVKGHAGTTPRRIRLYDVADGAASANSGPDDIIGQGGDDAVFGQGDADRLKGNVGDDYLEGGQDSDFVEGDTGDDDIVGGGSTILGGADQAAQGTKDAGDVLFGGAGNDVATGDNAVVVRVGPASPDANYTTKFTDRLNVDGSALDTKRWLRRLDLSVGGSLLTEPSNRFGGDRISGGTGVDVLFGQDGPDLISGGPNDDYVEGNGGADTIRGDALLSDAAVTNTFPPSSPSDPTDQIVNETTIPTYDPTTWVGTAGSATDLVGGTGPDGQDDLIGGSTLQGFRDGNDAIQGDGQADFELGDNGALVRDYSAPDGSGFRHYAVYNARYPTGSVPADAVIVRHNDTTIAGMTTTRFCITNSGANKTTCDVANAFGDDTMYGDNGDDTMWGQDGNDLMRGGDGRDDMYGELGDDYLYGDAGQDSVLGDRGGVVDTYINASGNPAFATPFSVGVQAPPAISYDAFTAGTYDRRTDLMHDVNGASFVSSVMPHDGVNEGGNDHVRGGGGHDNIHLGAGDDLANGDSGGDTIFGDDGADVLWGGKGCDPQSAEDYNGTCVDPASDRGDGDAYVDYLFGGKGGSSQTALKGDSGSDILDWQPRGTFNTNACSVDPWPQTLSQTVTIDPCDWFIMTNTYNDTSTAATHADNQTHHGVDWMYGGWDRDIMQADQANEGPNTGDRLLDWTGAYDLYSHCNPSYGGFNDVRELSPSEQTFMQKWSYGVGIGQQLSDVTTSGTSPFDELALVYTSDIRSHGNGQAFPTTPGHFDSPNACTY
jgi:Ca2+-binding RTX toxin-like protein